MLQGQQFDRPPGFPFPELSRAKYSPIISVIDSPTLGAIQNYRRKYSGLPIRYQMEEKGNFRSIKTRQKSFQDHQQSIKKKVQPFFPDIRDVYPLKKRSRFEDINKKKKPQRVPQQIQFRRVSTEPDNSLSRYLKKSKQKERQYLASNSKNKKQNKSSIGKRMKSDVQSDKMSDIHGYLQSSKKNSQLVDSKFTFKSLKTQFSRHRRTLKQIYSQGRRTNKAIAKIEVRIPQIPQKGQLSSFLLNYKPNNDEIDMRVLLKKNFCAIEYSESELYVGQMIGKHKNGTGILIMDSCVFEGEWKNNCRVKGVEITYQGIYRGNFVDNKRDGSGQYHRHAGDIYVGEWKEGKQHGIGLWINQIGESYNGSWLQGKAEGMGALTQNKRHFKGWFVNFKHSGFGKQTFSNGDSFQGVYNNDQPNGRGIYRWKNGCSFEGLFIDGRREGWGELRINSQVVYSGQFQNDKPEGECQIFMKNRSVWQGVAHRGNSKSIGHSRRGHKSSVQVARRQG